MERGRDIAPDIMPAHRSDMSARSAVACLFALVCAAIALEWALTGVSPLSANPYNSFAIQADSWLHGRMDVDYRPWLELAVYGGKYYVSFPPLPSVLLLPFAALLGETTPDHLLSLAAALLAALYCFRTARALGKTCRASLCWALLLTVGSNYLSVAMYGWVWFLAQNLAFMFSMMALYCAVGPRRERAWLALSFIALAVGCRPFNAAHIPVLAALVYSRDRAPDEGFIRFWLRRAHWLALPLCVAGGLCWYNWVRFGSITEFGHNYLPEFLASPLGQFNIAYLPQNLLRCVRVAEWRGDVLGFPLFDGWACYLVMPVYISAAVWGLRGGRLSAADATAILCILAQICMICMHKTMGGWHFGCRYLIDATPLVGLLAMRRCPSEHFLPPERRLLLLGLAVNIAGSAAFYAGWLG